MQAKGTAKAIMTAILPVIIALILEISLFLLTAIIWEGSDLVGKLVCQLGRVGVVVFLLLKYQKIFHIRLDLSKQKVLAAFLFGVCWYFVQSCFLEKTGENFYHWSNSVTGILIAPFFEEVLFRGWMLGYMERKKIPSIVALLVSSLLFGFWHQGWSSIFNAFVVGLFLGVAYQRTKNLMYPVFIHLSINICACLYSATSSLVWIQRSNYGNGYWLFWALGILLMVVMFYILVRKKNNSEAGDLQSL